MSQAIFALIKGKIQSSSRSDQSPVRTSPMGQNQFSISSRKEQKKKKKKKKKKKERGREREKQITLDGKEGT
ncbi:hypothetical protein ACN38_g9481 [Penicillium nordicum]|uniref:Uncharacterized protein n=1 Tax=Penicillium nordicum TaxID=229535 RepID=A0A0M9WCI9_9EURO|nr:hypothetical protein ACN38_g9481 [Penicillium nordicum]